MWPRRHQGLLQGKVYKELHELATCDPSSLDKKMHLPVKKLKKRNQNSVKTSQKGSAKIENCKLHSVNFTMIIVQLELSRRGMPDGKMRKLQTSSRQSGKMMISIWVPLAFNVAYTIDVVQQTLFYRRCRPN